MKKLQFSELFMRRWRVFWGDRWARFSLLTLIVVAFFSLSAELWSNSKPIYLSYNGKSFFPVLKDYHPAAFGQADQFVMDYKSLELSADDWALWPVNRWDPFESNTEVDSYPSAPSSQNWMGTDDRGRDVFARLLYGFRYSMSYALLVWALSTLIGTILGGAMGYFGGKFDLFGQRLVEIWSTIPTLFLLIILISIFQPSLGMLVVLTVLFSWMSMSYYIRAEFLKYRNLEFVEAARSMGAGTWSILLKHILPNSLTPIITFSPFIIAGQVYGLASLDYLGFGLPPPTPSWGELLKQAQKFFTIAWWLAAYPSAALFSTLVILSLIGQGIRSAFDPNKV